MRNAETPLSIYSSCADLISFSVDNLVKLTKTRSAFKVRHVDVPLSHALHFTFLSQNLQVSDCHFWKDLSRVKDKDLPFDNLLL